ncbi:hypothetical protein C8Q76DRAFT_754673 [Earliella scabrosa]|nr:hypothetical protein C8Q76DRAFT_754673 [Earliella scabrosa]
MSLPIPVDVDPATTLVNVSISDIDLFELIEGLTEIGVENISTRTTWADLTLRSMVEILCSSVLQGIYSILTVLALYLLCRKGLKSVASITMLTVILLLYSSTTAYWITVICKSFRHFYVLIGSHLWTEQRIEYVERILGNAFSKFVEPNYWITSLDDNTFPTVSPKSLVSFAPVGIPSGCTGTVTLTVNVVFGDAIVWWRALILWKGNRLIYAICALLLTATTVTGGLVTQTACQKYYLSGLYNATSHPGAFYVGDSPGLAASVLSLMSNVVATSLVGYKAWCHRRLIRAGFTGSSTRTRVERVLALLVESGTVYCILWIFVVVYQTMIYVEYYDSSSFTYNFDQFLEGCLIHLIGIYPTLIIILVSLGISHCDTVFTLSVRSNKEPGGVLPTAARPRRNTHLEVISIHHDSERSSTHFDANGRSMVKLTTLNNIPQAEMGEV